MAQNNNNLHMAIHYQEAIANQIGLRAQYINILRQEYSMLNGGNIPPLNFYVQITEAQIKRAKGMYENTLKSLVKMTILKTVH